MEIGGGTETPEKTFSNQLHSTSVMWRTIPMRLRFDVGTARRTRSSAATAEHFQRSVARCHSRKPTSVSRSPATEGGSGRVSGGEDIRSG